MTDPPQTREQSPAPSQQNAGADGDEQKPGGDKTRSRKKRIAFAILVIVAVSSVAGPTLWAGYLSLKLLWGPVSLPRPNDYEAALRNVLELQALAISEAKARRPAFFMSHVGCAAPRVWQDKRVLRNFQSMVDLGVEVKVLVGRKSFKGKPLPSPDWPMQLLAKLDEHGASDTLHMIPRELWCHSSVAGSKRRSQAYITSHEEMEIYPTSYITVRDNEACQEWKNYLMNVPIPQEATP